jgi:radical SAM protein with 4Fe4S-binding SPASM domain
MGSTRALVECLEEEGLLGHPQVEVYFAPVHSFHAEDMSPADLEAFSGLFQHVAGRQKALPIQNFDHLGQVLEMQRLDPGSLPRYCAVSAGTHYAVDPRGDLYECLEEAGDIERRSGVLAGGGIEMLDRHGAYQRRHLENRPECLQCSIALFCGGGCISQKRTQGGSVAGQFCGQNRIFVGQALKACYLRKAQGRVT